jgi:S-methylmethionine-dependent homocysteine/selenocysteine methylase
MSGAALRARILAAAARRAPPLVLDGALGTELERRGVSTGLPLWSARALWEAPDVVRAIHADAVRAGAEALTADTFRTQRRTLARAGRGERAAELTRLAVALARDAAGRATYVLGSVAPLEDCYRPDLVPAEDALAREHAEHAEHLAGAGADALWIETMNTVREAAAAARAASATGLPFAASFVCDARARLLSGEPLAAALDAVAGARPLAVSVNCLAPGALPANLKVLAASGLPFGVYPNLGVPDPVRGFAPSDDLGPEAFGAEARRWIAAGAAFVGGCCGTRAEHVAALAEAARG